MGRRAPRKIDPSLDLAPLLKTLEQLPTPWDTAALFGRDAPLEIEMGSGKGLFLESASAARAEHNFLGVEIAHKFAEAAAARVARRGRTNVRVVDGDGLRLFREFLPDETAVAVHVYFPDPWWKKRHRKRRVMNEPFIRDVQRVLVPGGSLHFWTDVEEYFNESLDLIAAVSTLTGPLPVPERPPEHDLDYRTHFERRMRMHGEPIYRAEYRKECPADE